MSSPVQDPKHPAIPEPSPDPVGTVTAILIGQLGSPYFFITFFLIILPLKHYTLSYIHTLTLDRGHRG